MRAAVGAVEAPMKPMAKVYDWALSRSTTSWYRPAPARCVSAATRSSWCRVTQRASSSEVCRAQ